MADSENKPESGKAGGDKPEARKDISDKTSVAENEILAHKNKASSVEAVGRSGAQSPVLGEALKVDAPQKDGLKESIAKTDAVKPAEARDSLMKGAPKSDVAAKDGATAKKIEKKTDKKFAPLQLPETVKAEAAKESESKAPTAPGAAEAQKAKPTHISQAPTQEKAKSSGGFWPTVFGGLIAGGIGFAGAWFLKPDGTNTTLAQIETLGARVDKVEAKLPELADLAGANKANAQSVAALEARVAEAESMIGTSGGVSASVATQADALAALGERVSALEKAPVTGSSAGAKAALDAYEREVAAMREEISQQMASINQALEGAKESEAEAAARQAEAVAAAERAREQQAFLEVQVALENGGAYAEALKRISSAQPPEGLAAGASGGVPTFEALKEEFPGAARNALRVAREETVGQDGGGMGSWLSRQLGARSLEPQQGDDANAVLSRAEAALNSGDLATALTEISALSEGGRAEMADWVARAEARRNALEGADALSSSLMRN